MFSIKSGMIVCLGSHKKFVTWTECRNPANKYTVNLLEFRKELSWNKSSCHLTVTILYVHFHTFFRAATAALVDKHSKEMMRLIQEKRSEYLEDEEVLDYPSQPPPPQPPPQTKTDIYTDPDEFAEVDQLAIQVMKETPSVRLSICLSIYLFICSFLLISPICRSACLVYLSVYLPIHSSIHLFVCFRVLYSDLLCSALITLPVMLSLRADSHYRSNRNLPK